MKTETRVLSVSDVELRTVKRDDGEEFHLVYTAPPFGSWSVDLGGFRERIDPEAFTESGEDVIATLEHNNALLLGRVSAGTLTMEATDDGFINDILLNPNTTAGRDAKAHAERGDIKGASFEFAVLGDEWNEELTERTVTKGVLYQTGPVANPAYEMNDVEVAHRSRARVAGERGVTWEEELKLREQMARVGVLFVV